jgi:nucleotide-binding universal stress UspA family protein
MHDQEIRRFVTVGVDGTRSAQRAVRWAAAEAGRRRSPLRLVTAFGWPSERYIDRREIAKNYRGELHDLLRGELEGAAAIAALEAPGIEIQQQLTVGYPIPVLVEEAERAQLIVVGDRGAGRIEGAVTGSVAVALAAHASCPIVIVRGTEPEPAQTAALPVVVGVDGSPTSEAAIAFAYDAAAARNVPLVAVHTWLDQTFGPTLAPMLDWGAIETEERQVLSQRLAGWAEKYPDVRVEQLVTCDRPAASLLEQAASAQLVVVGSRGRSEFSGLILGSVSHALVHRSPCPVAVVHPHDGAADHP